MSAKVRWSRLDEPFKPSDIHWRIGRTREGRSGHPHRASLLAYLDARNVMERLDEVFGKGGWTDTYSQGPDGGVKCRLAVWDADEERWVFKEDGAENTAVEAIKGGYSGAFKRAAVKLGVGRYLYALDGSMLIALKGWGDDNTAERFKAKNDGGWWHVPHPRLPSWATPRQPEGEAADEPAKVPALESHPSWDEDRKGFCAAIGDHFDGRPSDVFRFCEDVGWKHPKTLSNDERERFWSEYLSKAGTVSAFKAWQGGQNAEG